jgi:hypothetical protein
MKLSKAVIWLSLLVAALVLVAEPLLDTGRSVASPSA